MVLVFLGGGLLYLCLGVVMIEYDCWIMFCKFFVDLWCVCEEIVQFVVCLIVEDGLDYVGVKCKVVCQLLGDLCVVGEWLLDNDQIEEELCEYFVLFQSDMQLDELCCLCEIVFDWMCWFVEFYFYVMGVVLNGIVNVYLDIYLQVFIDNLKDVVIYLLNQNVQYDVFEMWYFVGCGDVEMFSFLWCLWCDVDVIGIYFVLYVSDDLCGVVKVDVCGCVFCVDVVVLCVFVVVGQVFFELE